MDAVTPAHLRTTAFLDGGGELGRLIAEFDWAGTSAGPIESWSQVMKTTVGLVLRSPVPIVTLWGATGVMIYNDGYAAFAGRRHPQILGMDVLEAWPEAADWNRRIMDDVFHGGGTISVQDMVLELDRRGTAEPAWLNLDYSPVLDEQGAPCAVIAIVVETTAKVRAERQLSGERARLERMFHQAPGFMALLEGPEHRFTMANEAYSALVGGREVLGKTVVEALPEVAEQGFVALLGEVYRSRQPYIGRATPVVLNRVDGAASEERFVDFVYQPLLDDQGELTGIFVQGHDVTEQQQAVRALQETEERFRLVAERAPVMLWMGDQDGKCLYLNKAQRDFWGLTEADIAGFQWGSSLHPDDQQKLYAPFAEGMANHTPFTVEARYKRADGLYRRMHTHAEPRFDGDGQFLGMIGVNTDITDVREAEERYRRLFEQASDLILTADLQQRITDCNPAAAAAVGLAREQAIGRNIAEFISEEDYGRTTEMLRNKLEGGGTTQYDVRVRSSTGEWLFWEINSGLTFDDGGSPVGLHVVARDVTERKRFERHQQLLVGELNHRVKNTLAIVQSLTHQSFHSDVPADEAIRRFEGRLQALAAAHNLLTHRNWDSALMTDVVSAAMAPFCSNERCAISGPPLFIPPQTAVNLALALHELATNAAKYGSLSNRDGRIDVHWTTESGRLHLTWRESGGPEVTPPDRRGFGSRMIERTLASEFGGTVELRFEPSGVTCQVSAPLPQPLA
ncbi:MAG TPA: PAS domain S-box protein [Sphingomicrobium sp.]|jgi:PAS domain S-box-containing protein